MTEQQMSIRERVKALNDEFKAIKTSHAELKMREGKFNENLAGLVTELTGSKSDESVNLSEILYSALIATA